MLMFAEFIEEQKSLNLTRINSTTDILLFLDTRKSKEQDPEQKWMMKDFHLILI